MFPVPLLQPLLDDGLNVLRDGLFGLGGSNRDNAFRMVLGQGLKALLNSVMKRQIRLFHPIQLPSASAPGESLVSW
jgi:hypothetical protein